MKRRATVALGGLLAAGALSGCQPVVAGAAAVVGRERISVGALRDLVQRSLADPQARQRFGDASAFQRRELTQLIDRRLLRAAAARLGVDVSAGDVDARLEQFAEQSGGRDALQKQAAAAGVAPGDLHDAVADLVLSDAVADKVTSAQQVSQAQLQAAYQQSADAFDQVRSAHILVRDERTARSLLAQVTADPKAFAALARRYSTDPGSKDEGGELGFNGRGKLVKPFSDAVFSTPPGRFTIAHTEFGWHVIKVEARRTVTLEQATPQLRRQLLRGGRDSALQAELAKVAGQEHVSVSPRYGRWDGSKVVADSDRLSRPAATPAPAGGGLPGGAGPGPADQGGTGEQGGQQGGTGEQGGQQGGTGEQGGSSPAPSPGG